MILGRYLLRIYLKVFLLSVSGFVALLLVTRMKEIAGIASLASSISSVLLFTLYQIPYILPIAIPISSIISAFFLFQTLSKTQEITSLRSSGFSLVTIIKPIIALALILSIINFFICSELTTFCNAKSKELTYKQSILNPLLLLQRQSLTPINIKNSFVDMKSTNSIAKDVIVITSNPKLNLFSAQSIQIEKDKLKGTNISIISHLNSDSNKFDSLIIENQKTTETSAPEISSFIKTAKEGSSLKYLSISSIIKNKDFSVEIIRRLFTGSAAFTFTFIGISFGLEIGRKKSRKGVLFATSLSLLILIGFLSAKALKYHDLAAIFALILPQLIAFFIALRNLSRVARGLE